jgi:EAL domain-containing protein (putative c-di-GMP-specific phosphodiesterase class I)
VEALVRWRHPTRGLLYPDSFIELAEQAGLMKPLTLSVLDQALAQSARWRADGLDLAVAVNVSPSNLVDLALPDQVADLLDRYGLPTSALTLEVTEAILMQERERAMAVLSRLRSAGVGISIDDYGTGYSSLAYLAELPVTELKLDRSFVSRIVGDAGVAAIVRSTIDLAHALGLVLVAEGVEDEASLVLLATFGCDVAQGYHLSRPLAADPLTAWLHTREDRPLTGRPRSRCRAHGKRWRLRSSASLRARCPSPRSASRRGGPVPWRAADVRPARSDSAGRRLRQGP